MTERDIDERQIFAGIHRMACLLLGNYHDAWDLAQEVFLELEKGRSKWENAGSRWAWAVGVFRRQLKRFLRLQKRRKFAPLNENCISREISAEKNALVKEELEQTFAALHRLNRETAEALLLFSLEKLPIQEIARIQDVSQGTVKWRIFEARRRIALEVHPDNGGRGGKRLKSKKH